MSRLVLAIFVPFLFLSSAQAVDCDIFIHGYTPEGKDYFGDLPRQVIWDANQPIEESAPEVSKKILEQMETCPAESIIILRPHSYGAAQTQYILGKGHQFQRFYPDHDYVKIYKRTFSVYAYTGAFHGTPLMDLVCSNGLTRAIGELFGRSCVKSLTTSKIHNVASLAPSSGVPTHLIYSSNRSGYYGLLGAILSKHMVSWWDFVIRGVRNQNDNTLPTYATRGCASKRLMRGPQSNCPKLDSNFFIDFHHIQEDNHTSFVKDKEVMLLKDEHER